MIKTQALADYIIKQANDKQRWEQEVEREWAIYIDSSSNTEVNGAGIILLGPKGKKFVYALRL